MSERRRAPLRQVVVEAFVAANFAFLTIDVYLAHLANAFARPSEWVPVGFSAVGAAALLPGIVARRVQVGAPRWVGYGVGVAAVLVGIAGLMLHLRSQFFLEQTIESLVYAAPFIAPLAYAGLGLLLVLNRTETTDDARYCRWVVLLALGGFVGNFALSLADHAQNGFFYATEWIPVVSAAFATGFLLVVVMAPPSPAVVGTAAIVMGVQIVVGVVGFFLHLLADIEAQGFETPWNALIHGAPIFAPLLYPNLAALALLGLHGLWAPRLRWLAAAPTTDPPAST